MHDDVSDSDLARVTRTVDPSTICRVFYDCRGRRRVVGPTGILLGRLVSDVDAERLDQLNEEIAADGLDGARGIALAAGCGVLLFFALSYAVWHHGRWFERRYGVGIHESRFSVG